MNIRTAARALAVAALAATTLSGLDTGSAAASGGTKCTPYWKTVPVPADTMQELDSVQVFSAKDVLTVGDQGVNGPRNTIYRWDGKAVSALGTTPEMPRANYATTFGASFSSDDEGWLVNTLYGGGMLEHWHGGGFTAAPLAVPADPHRDFNQIVSTATLSPTDAWAVGIRQNVGSTGTGNHGAAIEHWDGTEWTIVPNPADDRYAANLNAVYASAPDDVWAAGRTPGASAHLSAPLLEHWDGNRWAEVPSPTGAGVTQLTHLDGTGPDDVWAGGWQWPDETAPSVPFLEHWDGTAWSVVTLPDGATGGPVHAVAPGDVWLGFTHLSGGTWTIVDPSLPQGWLSGGDVTAMDGSGPDDVWAAGVGHTYGVPNSFGIPMYNTPLLLHYSCGKV